MAPEIYALVFRGVHEIENRSSVRLMGAKGGHIVLTGAAGFIGGYIVEEALSQGYSITGVDNFSKYGKVTRSYDNHAHYELVEGDAQDVDLLKQLFLEADHVIAAAAMIGGITYFHSYPYDLLAMNERIIASTCDAAIEAFPLGRLKKVTYLSSSMVFESADHWPSTEGEELLIPPPHSSYGFQKLSTEYFARAAWDQYRIPFTILRPFNCVGIGERRALGDVEITSGSVSLAMSHVVPDLIQKIVKGQDPLLILGSGEQVRCYTYGGDLAQGIVGSLDTDAATNEDFNLSTSRAITVLELAELIWVKIHGSDRPFSVEHEAPYQHDVQKRIPEVSKARDLLGFVAETPIEDVLDELIPWIEEAIECGQI
jgi:UDP-glucose 4-epimerase